MGTRLNFRFLKILILCCKNEKTGITEMQLLCPYTQYTRSKKHTCDNQPLAGRRTVANPINAARACLESVNGHCHGIESAFFRVPVDAQINAFDLSTR